MRRNATRYFTGTGTNTGDVMFTTENVENCNIFTFSTSVGASTIEATLDGTNWTAAMAFQDLTATASATYVAATVATKMYKLEGKYRQLRMKQSGATAATGIMCCGSPGVSL
jgi:hypothetical protein